MTSLAIPSVPPPAGANIDAATPPAEADSRFGDVLRESQAQPKATDDGHSGDPDAGSPPRKDAGADVARQDDKTGASDPAVLPGMVAPVSVAAVPVRQSPAVAGKSVPAAVGSAGTQPADPQPKPFDPDAIATPAAVAIAVPADSAPVVDAPVSVHAPDVKAPGPGTPVAHPPITILSGANAPIGNASGTNVPTADASEANASIAPSVGTGSAQSSTPETDVATALSTGDLDANPSAADPRSDPRTTPNSGSNAFAGQLAQLAGMHTGTAPAQPSPAPVQLAMQSMPGQPQFAQEVGQHVSWLAGQNLQQAEIQLNPKKLGPIQVEITTHHDRVDVTFAVQHPQTVHALQQTLPQLHDMLAQQGLNLGHASVGQQAPGRQHPAFAQHAGGGPGRDSSSAQAAPPPTWRTLRVAVPGRVDDFA